MIEIDVTEKVKIRKASSMSQKFIFCRQVKEGNNFVCSSMDRPESQLGHR